MMTEEQLIDTLQKFVVKSKKQLEEYTHFLDQKIEEKEKIAKTLAGNIDNIVEVDFELIKELVASFLISNDEKKNMIKEMELIVQLLALNKDDGTTLSLNSRQNKIMADFLTSVQKYIDDRNKFMTKRVINKEKIEADVKTCKKIIRSLKNSKNMSFITDVLTLDSVFDKMGINDDDKNDMYQFILKYNRKIYDYKTGNCNVRELEILGKTDVNELKKIFTSFGFDFDMLPREIQENIIERATVSNIKGVFKALKDNGYVMDILKDAYLLMALLIESDQITINKISKLAFAKGLNHKEILRIGSILIKQSRSKVRSSRAYERFCVEDIEENGLKIVGAAEDFEKNIKELGKWGFSVRYVYDRCCDVLACSNAVLCHNLNLFQDYGFSLKSKANKLCSATMSALMSYNTVEIIDRFIEVHPFGLEYLKSNLSVLRQVKDLEDLVFYKLYYSNKSQGSKEAFMKIIDNDYSCLCMQGEVGGLSSAYIETYASINEDNKYLVTGAFIPTYSRDYYSLIKNKIDKEIMASIFDNPYIQHVNKYSDSNEVLLYNFDGIRISKMKTLRVFDALLSVGVAASDESFLFALLYNTIISKDDFKRLSKMAKLES